MSATGRLEGLLARRMSLRSSLFAAVIIGTVAGLHVFGFGYVAGTSDFWTYPVGDAAMMTTGWNYYINDRWQWPLLRTALSRGPDGINLLYFDAIPIASIVSKVVKSLFGFRWNPFGLWHLVDYVLQAVFAILIGRRLGLRNWGASIGLMLLAVSMSVFVLRYYHEGLNGQFVLLWGLLLYLRALERRRTVAAAAEWTACLSFAALQHPYLFVMVLPAFAAATVRATQLHWRGGLTVAGLAVGMVGLILLMCGYASETLPPDPGGFGLASMNLMSLVVPIQSSIIPSLPDPALQDATTVQLDGQNFLGLGLLLLLCIALLTDAKSLLRPVWKHRSLAAPLFLLALYAPSDRWYLGRRLLLGYDVPRVLQPLAATFRATGRFFWPVAYALLVLVVVVIARRYPKRGAALILVASMLQVVDSEARVRVVRDYVGQAWRRQLDWSAWERSIASVDAVDTYPSYQCWDLWPYPPGLGDLLLQEQEIEFMAATAGKRTNGGRAGRLLTNCDAERATARELLATHSAPPGHLVVLMKLRFEPVQLEELRAHLQCEDSADTLRCSRR